MTLVSRILLTALLFTTQAKSQIQSSAVPRIQTAFDAIEADKISAPPPPSFSARAANNLDSYFNANKIHEIANAVHQDQVADKRKTALFGGSH